jgi:hypothetical protein
MTTKLSKENSSIDKPVKKKSKKILPVVEVIKPSPLSAQEVFDKVLNHLRQQGKKSFSNPKVEGECAYKDCNGLKCGIGALILDEEYSSALEHYTVDQMLFLPTTPQSLKDRLQSHCENWFLRDLQNIHDVYPVADWEIKFEEVAKRHKLTYTKIK